MCLWWNKKKYFETKENEIYKNLRDRAKVVLGWNFVAINAYIKKQKKKFQINNLTILQDSKKRTMPKFSRRKEINITAEVN